ncbi:hypothetical protein BEL04_13875 [Mucilaginibacter sp. PPCGB 2223]|uniref:DUF4199 domain-containing protein n=1 Tax=Mucilaginibacter sp. PPCGB 2223 TaxID=1886027 RepID=UPI000825DD97|nr:DUF4199 domain-containing protein [Mucilaginibacter sp. PPCGB 2223]OCX52538.1 hypothetical protein BEL04_13875 [Mucilaginibacter sp. PPCGB 2223]
MKKTVWVFGSISGLIFVLWMATIYTACYNNPNMEASMWMGYGCMIVAFAFVFVGVKNFRDKYNGGTITFGKAFKVGLYIALIGSSAYVAAWLVDFYVFMPDFMDKYMAHELLRAKNHGATLAELNKQKEQMQTMANLYKTPVGVILLTYLEVLPVGLIMTLIAALILKRKPEENITAAV